VTIRSCTAADRPQIFEIINDAARAYQGIIPADRWHEPYMPMPELEAAIADNIVFSVYEERGRLLGVMGIQDRGEVVLIRHAYVRSSERRKGIGEKLLKHLAATTQKPVLIGTWRAAAWAIRFYEKNGYRLLPKEEAEPLMRKYWGIPERQVETSVVLAK
jgi:GNAT superfamily N-acetyltransferase